MSREVSSGVQDDASLRRILTVAFTPCFVPPARSHDTEHEMHMRETAARFILSGHPQEWHSWASHHGIEDVAARHAFHIRGTVFLHAGDLDSAELFLRGALDLRRGEADTAACASTLVNLAEVALRRLQLDDAWELLTEALHLDPSLEAVHINRHCVADVAGREDWSRIVDRDLNQHVPEWESNELVVAGLRAFRMHCTSLR